MVHKIKISLFLSVLLLISSCINNATDDAVYNNATDSETSSPIRSITDVQKIAMSFLDGVSTRGVNSLKIEAMTTSDFKEPMTRSIGVSYLNADTLLYFITGIDNPMIISANKHCSPVLAILDNQNVSIKEAINHPSDENAGLLAFIENAAIYNQIDDFNPNSQLPMPVSSNVIEEVIPKVKVSWDQNAPFNRYAPNGCVAGCVAIATAQAMTVTRHIGSLNGVYLDWDNLIKVQTAADEHRYPNETDVVARFIRQIGVAVKMDYGQKSSGAKTKDAVELFTFGGLMNLTKDKKKIREVLRDYSDGIIIISSRTKKSVLGIKKGTGHCYVADGYKIFQDGSDLIHINYGWGSWANGYYLSKLASPHFTEDAKEKFPHAWEFYCLYKKPR